MGNRLKTFGDYISSRKIKFELFVHGPQWLSKETCPSKKGGRRSDFQVDLPERSPDYTPGPGFHIEKSKGRNR